MGGSCGHVAGRSGRRPLMLAALAGVAGALGVAPRRAGAQVACDRCTRYAITNLNQRKGPAETDAILQVVPGGAAVVRESDTVVNGYTIVTWLGVRGYVVALGLSATPPPTAPPAAPPGPTPAPPPPDPAPTPPGDDLRVALAPLNLRSGPAEDAPVLATIPEGDVLVLTREGADNGYVTVDWGGARGWVYADLIGEP